MTMRSLRERFATLDRLPAPDLWSDVEQRATSLASAERLASVTVRHPERRGATGDRTVAVLLAAAVLVALAAAIAVGSGLVRLSAPDGPLTVDASPPPVATAPVIAVTSPAPSAIATGSATPAPRPDPWVVFGRRLSGIEERFRSHSWAMRADGTGAHEIHAGATAWSPDGTRLLANDGHLWVAEVGDDIGPFVDTGVVTPDAEQWEAFDLAPDDEHVVFVRKSKCAKAPTAMAFGALAVIPPVITAETAGANCYVLAIADLAKGTVTDLPRTLVKDQTADQNVALELPAWSPDGRRIAYTRLDERRDIRQLWLVDADGTDPSSVAVPAGVTVQEPRWSPDGTRIAFTSHRWLTVDTSESLAYVLDLATGGLTQVSTGSVLDERQVGRVEWLDDSHLRVEAGDWQRAWQVDLERPGAEPVLLADLTDPLDAIDPPGRVVTISAPGDPGRTFRWQPVPPAAG
jgi:hypothetical protein